MTPTPEIGLARLYLDIKHTFGVFESGWLTACGRLVGFGCPWSGAGPANPGRLHVRLSRIVCLDVHRQTGEHLGHCLHAPRGAVLL